MLFFSGFILAVLFGVSYAHSSSYYCKWPGHTMCKYQESGLGPKCGDRAKSVPPTTEEKQAIVNAHNELRSKVALGKERRGAPGPQPPAADMREFTWDDEIASIAQRLADQCEFKHDKERSIDAYFVGQNLYLGPAYGDGKPDYDDVCNAFYSEVEFFPKSKVRRLKVPEKLFSKIGHYSQLVWADTKTVGCGATTYYDREGRKVLVACNYGPTGNYPGGQVYQEGKACSHCPPDTTCTTGADAGLCRDDKFDVDPGSQIDVPETSSSATCLLSSMEWFFNLKIVSIGFGLLVLFDGGLWGSASNLTPGCFV